MNLNINYPTSLQEIPLQSYQKWLAVSDTTTDDEILAFKFVQIFTGLDLKTISQMNYKDVNFLIEKISQVLTQQPKFTQRWKFGKIEFGFIPNLEEISWGEYIDIEANLDKFDTLHKAMAVLFRPITKTLKDTYEIEIYRGDESYEDVMKLLPLSIALGSSVFFWNLENDLLKVSLESLKNKTKTKTNEIQANTQKKTSSQKNGGGITQYTDLLKATLKDWTMSQPYPLERLSLSYRMKPKRRKSNTTSIKGN